MLRFTALLSVLLVVFSANGAGISSGAMGPWGAGGAMSHGWPVNGDNPLAQPACIQLRYSASDVDGAGNSTLSDNDQLDAWVNLGAHGSDGDLAQATSTRKPSFNNDCGAASDLECVDFDGNDHLTDAVQSLTVAQPYIACGVYSNDVTTGQYMFTPASTDAAHMHADVNAVYAFSGSWDGHSTRDISTNQWERTCWRANGASSTWDIAGSGTEAASVGTNDAEDGARVGCRHTGLNCLDGKVREFLVADNTCTIEDVTTWLDLLYPGLPAAS